MLGGLLAIAVAFVLWWVITLGQPEYRWIPNTVLPSPAETFSDLDTLIWNNPRANNQAEREPDSARTWAQWWQNQKLIRNTVASLRRVLGGFALAILIGIPIGVLCGSFPRVSAFWRHQVYEAE